MIDIFGHTQHYHDNADYVALHARLQDIQQCVNSRGVIAQAIVPDNKKENINKELLLLLDD